MESIKELRKICQPKAKDRTDIKIFGYRFIRWICIYPTWILLRTKITANQITMIGLIFAWIGIFLISIPSQFLKYIGFILMFLYVISDGCDGEVAWYRKKPTKNGYYLDQIGHFTTFPFLFTAVGFNLLKTTHNINYLILGFSTAIAMIILMVNSKLPRLIDSSERKKLVFQEIAKKKNKGFSISVLVGKIHKNLTYNFYVGSYILVGFITADILSKQSISQNLIPFIMIFYAVLFTITLIAQVIIYYKNMENKSYNIR